MLETSESTVHKKMIFTCFDITDIEPPVFHNCPNEDLTIYKEAWGPVFVNISIPTAVDNSGISPRQCRQASQYLNTCSHCGLISL
jgi:hypothetical protein